jgi:hypothetical protein
VAIITEYEQIQGSEQYSSETYYDLRFRPLNPISSDGSVKLTWSSDVEVFEDSKCLVETYSALGEICEIDFQAKSLIIHGSFSEVDVYTGPIKILLTHVRNPATNKDLIPFAVETFDDHDMEFPVDKLLYPPSLVCNWPC